MDVPRPVKGKAPVCIRCRRPLERHADSFQCQCGFAFVVEPIPGTPYHLPQNPKDAA